MAKTVKGATKSEIYKSIGEATDLSRKQVASVFEALAAEAKKGVGKRGPGMFTIPGLAKIVTVKKLATPARKGINPFTKEEQMFKAKPARTIIKVRPLRALKDMVA